MTPAPATAARELRIRGTVQGVGFRPFVYRLARRYAVQGWVLNGADGVQLHVEGPAAALDAFARAVVDEAPPAARIAAIASQPSWSVPSRRTYVGPHAGQANGCA